MLFVTPGTTPYVPHSEREKPEGERVVFDLAILTAREFADLQDDALDELGLGMRRGTYIFGLLRRGLRGVRGPEGTPEITFDEKTGYCSEAFLDRLTGELKTELAGALDNLNTVGPAKGKASES